jgi:hypothetical protein
LIYDEAFAVLSRGFAGIMRSRLELLSTIRTASIRSLGGSTPKRLGGSPLSPHTARIPLGRDNEVLVE